MLPKGIRRTAEIHCEVYRINKYTWRRASKPQPRRVTPSPDSEEAMRGNHSTATLSEMEGRLQFGPGRKELLAIISLGLLEVFAPKVLLNNEQI